MKNRFLAAVIFALGASTAAAVSENYYLMRQIEQERDSLIREIRRNRQTDTKSQEQQKQAPPAPPPVATEDKQTPAPAPKAGGTGSSPHQAEKTAGA